MSNTTFIVNSSDLKNYQIIENQNQKELKENEVFLKIERFAFTANNVTYGILGRSYGYFKFFETDVTDGGIIPVWGIGQVVASKCDGVKVGERVYGYYPMAKFALFKATNVTSIGFFVPRVNLPADRAVYNTYYFVSKDPLSINFTSKQENYMMLYRPLFFTSFLLVDFIRENKFFNSKQIIVSSASSKTAFCFGYLVKSANCGIKVIGLTSPNNLNYVKKINCYDQVIQYDSITSIAPEETLFIDIAGDKKLLSRVFSHVGKNKFKMSITVGISHWENAEMTPESKEIPSALFFCT